MTRVFSKAAFLARSGLRRIAGHRGQEAVTLPPRESVPVDRFELPACPEALRSASRDELIESYWRLHPRFNFFKAVPPESRVLDVGVGIGGLPFWRQFLSPNRDDVRMFGIDLVKPVSAAVYEQFIVGNLDQGIPYPAAAFDAVLASHVLEHVADRAHCLEAIARCLRQGGLAYIETPAPSTKTLPTAEAYRASGWPMTISNFHDDATHRDVDDLDTLTQMAASCGLSNLQRGYVIVPYLQEALVARGHEWKDAELMLYGYWSMTRWAQFAVFERK